ncbi:hypothetical protein NDU88_004059 [Pleurodeles waltl]|uniref:Uncharacterized protein n=1 Tax=Pleurodeles waltl TaxID=8319 RepID=A0AAV7SHP6_PLEWA|nr:hypothetical protein NDU88_004059 [Pleurodeles waltl]
MASQRLTLLPGERLGAGWLWFGPTVEASRQSGLPLVYAGGRKRLFSGWAYPLLRRRGGCCAGSVVAWGPLVRRSCRGAGGPPVILRCGAAWLGRGLVLSVDWPAVLVSLALVGIFLRPCVTESRGTLDSGADGRSQRAGDRDGCVMMLLADPQRSCGAS